MSFCNLSEIADQVFAELWIEVKKKLIRRRLLGFDGAPELLPLLHVATPLAPLIM